MRVASSAPPRCTLLVCALLAACGDDSAGPDGNPHTFDALPDAPMHDAPVTPDGPMLDGAPDALALFCGSTSAPVFLLSATGEASAAAPMGASLFMGSCGGAGPETIYLVTVPQPLASLTATTDLPQTTLDPFVYLRSSCDEAQSELACVVGRGAATAANVAAGDYYVFVDTASSTVSGVFALRVTGIIPQGGRCDAANTQFVCGSGHRCVERTAGQGTHCEQAQCANGIDDDGDGHIDFPFDPGCTSAEDDDETDGCPATCPQCANGIDDDGDGLIDYPADPGCGSASDTSETDDCTPGVPVSELDANGQATGNTVGGANHYMGTCGGYMTGGNDQVAHYRVDRPTRTVFASLLAPDLQSAAFVYIRKNDCGSDAAQVSCGGPGLTARASADSPVIGDNLFFIVDTLDSSQTGSWTLQITVALERGAACTPSDTWRRCASGLKCAGNLCVPTQCADGIDNDGDGKIDYPLDPGCTTASDDDETDTCPSGASCPQCGNGIDDDGDGLIDYPGDPGCLDASDPNEGDECSGVPVTDITATGAATGNTMGAPNVFTPGCTTSTAPERVFLYRLAAPVSTLTASLCGSGYDTALYIRYGACNTADVGCDDDSCGMPIPNQSQVTLQNPPAGNYYIIVDGYMNHSGPFALTVVTTP